MLKGKPLLRIDDLFERGSWVWIWTAHVASGSSIASFLASLAIGVESLRHTEKFGVKRRGSKGKITVHKNEI